MHRVAFGDDDVPALVDALRTAPGADPRLWLVATAGQDVVGHVMVTPVPLESGPGSTRTVACLSPLGVRPDAQGEGTGRALVEAACAAAQAVGHPLVVLEGDPQLYVRFGFVPARSVGLRRPSERIPEAAFQVRLLDGYDPGDPGLRGRVLYPDAFWDVPAVGLPVSGPTFLDGFEQQCRLVEGAVASAGVRALVRPVPACPGWTVADVLRHLGMLHRFVASWVVGGRRPRVGPDVPDDDAAALTFFAEGWRDLHALLDDRPVGAPTATWSPWDATCGFWRRRMAHEVAVHALDVAEALGPDSLRHVPSGPLRGNGSAGWSVPDDLALDGVDEVVRLWLGTRLGAQPGGDGVLVRLAAAAPHETASQRFWTVGLHGGITETHEVDVAADVVVTAPPVVLYRWLWGRADDDEVGVELRTPSGSTGVPALRDALRAALQ